MAQPFFVRLSNAGYAQYPDLFVAQVLEGFSPGSPPQRPHPIGPVDPGYSPPWAQVPVDPGYGVPIGGRPGGPVDPGYSPPWAQAPVDPGYGVPIGGRPHPSHPIVLPDPLPPDLGSRPGIIVPPAGSPGSPSNPYPPGGVPPHAAQGIQKFHVWVDGVGVVGPYYMGPGGVYPGAPSAPPDATTKPGGEKPPVTLPPGVPPPVGTVPPQAPR